MDVFDCLMLDCLLSLFVNLFKLVWKVVVATFNVLKFAVEMIYKGLCKLQANKKEQSYETEMEPRVERDHKSEQLNLEQIKQRAKEVINKQSDQPKVLSFVPSKTKNDQKQLVSTLTMQK